VPCWLNCFAGGAVVASLAVLWWRPVAVSWLTDGDSQTVMLLLPAVEKRRLFFPSLPFSSSSSAAFPFPFCSDLDGVSFQDLTSSRVSIVFLNSHGPLSFTSHCPSRSVCFFFFLFWFAFPFL